jgi:hypothetical protein
MIIPAKSQFNWFSGFWQDDFQGFNQSEHVIGPGQMHQIEDFYFTSDFDRFLARLAICELLSWVVVRPLAFHI